MMKQPKIPAPPPPPPPDIDYRDVSPKEFAAILIFFAVGTVIIIGVVLMLDAVGAL